MKELKNEKSGVLLHIALIRLNEEIRVAGFGGSQDAYPEVCRMLIRGSAGCLSEGPQDNPPTAQILPHHLAVPLHHEVKRRAYKASMKATPNTIRTAYNPDGISPLPYECSPDR